MVGGSSAIPPPSQQLDVQTVHRPQAAPEQRHKPDNGVAREVSSPKSTDQTGQSEQQARDEALGGSEVGTDQLQDIMTSLNEALKPIRIGLDYEKRDNGKLVVKVMNEDTDEVIRQIPPEAMLKMAQRIDEMTGLLVDIWR